MILVVLTISAFLRLYQIGPLLGFWYDQGRDALVIWDLLHYGKFFLLGPVTGVDGIFLGPFYYYLLTPFYWLGGGNPVFPAVGLVILTVLAVYLVYWLATLMYDRRVGLLAAFFYGFSYQLVLFSRWLANPNPLPLFSLGVLVFLYRFTRGWQNALIWAFLLIGLSLQLEVASAVWFLPATFSILVWQRVRVKSAARVLLGAVLLFLATLLPQLIFNFRHQRLLFKSFEKFLAADRSFRLSWLEVLKARVELYYDVFFNQLFPGNNFLSWLLLALFSAGLILGFRQIFNPGGKLLFIWLLAPLLGFLFYQGNYGYVWGYYFAGVVPVFAIVLSAALVYLVRHRALGFLVVAVVFFFLVINLRSLATYYQTGIGITLRAQLRALDWIYQDAGPEEFNVDVYVPPQVYYAYSYLFRWYGQEKYGREPDTRLVKTLYTLAEPDNEHPQFLQAWQERQNGIGIIQKEYFWGDITVQKRERRLYE